MPKPRAMRKVIQRKRKQVHAAPADPADLTSLAIPDSYKSYEWAPGRTEQFLLVDTGAGPGRILIFGREGNMTWCGEVQALYLDGTFKQAPPLFHQIYVVLAERNGFVFPLLYALLPNKRRQTYQILFQTIARKWPTLQPNSLSVDFEIAAFQEAQSAFPNAQVRRLRPNGRANMSRAQTDRRPSVLRQDGRAQTVAPKCSRPDVVHRTKPFMPCCVYAVQDARQDKQFK
jgi:hypothetical protein